jgi:hypothetical protein
MTMLQAIASPPSAASAILAVDDWSNYVYLILIVLSGLGAIANKAIERFGGKKGADVQSPGEGAKPKYPPLVTKNKTPRATPQPTYRPAPPPMIAPTAQRPRPAPQPVRPVARPLSSRGPAPAPSPVTRTARPAPTAKRQHAGHENLPSEIAELITQRASAEAKKPTTGREKAPSRRIGRAPLSDTRDTHAASPTSPQMVLGLGTPDELRRAILLREILGPPVALRDEDPWSI